MTRKQKRTAPRRRRDADHARLKKAVAESEQRYRSLFENMLEGVAHCEMVFDGATPKDFRYLEVNKAFETLTGLKNVAGKMVSEVIPGIQVSNPELFATYGRVARTGKPERFETHVPSLGIWFSVAVHSPRRGYFTAMFDNVTTRKRAEQALTLFRTLIDRSNDAIEVIDPETARFLDVNEKGCLDLGYSREEFLTLSVFDIDPRVDRPTFTRLTEELRKSGALVWEGVHRRKDGSTFPVEVNIKYVQVDRDYLVTVVRDITERERAEAELRHSEAAYRELVAHATYGIYRSSRTGQFLSVNPALARILGYDSETDLLHADLGKDIYADPAERSRLLALYEHASAVPRSVVEWRRKDGTRCTVALSGRPLHDANGELECFEMFVEDVTEQQVLESQLRQSQKMEAVGQLTAGIAHDFNNILTAVLANADLVVQDIPKENSSVLADLHDIQTAARRGADMIKKLMAFSRRERLDVKALDLSQALHDTTAMLRRVLPESIAIEMVEEPVGNVFADRTALEQMLLNLATNARDAMPEGGSLRIAVTRVSVDQRFRSTRPFAELGEYVRIAVTDAGTGMDEATKARVFEPFFTTKAPGQGTGLGLAMVYGMMKQHGGFVTLDSEVNAGATVALYFLPVSGGSVAPVEDLSSAGLRGGSERILVVEDEEAIRRSVQRVLQRHGYAVTTVADGQEALALLREQPAGFDLVITDVVMPKMSGRKLYKRATELGGRARFLFTSGYPKNDMRDTGELDLQDLRLPFIQKPWTTADLLQRVRGVLDAPA
jgi:PAS domain S-box-containing protein